MIIKSTWSSTCSPFKMFIWSLLLSVWLSSILSIWSPSALSIWSSLLLYDHLSHHLHSWYDWISIDSIDIHECETHSLSSSPPPSSASIWSPRPSSSSPSKASSSSSSPSWASSPSGWSLAIWLDLSWTRKSFPFLHQVPHSHIDDDGDD